MQNTLTPHPLVFEVVQAAVVRENEPPLPPALNESRLGAFMEIATARWSGRVRGAGDVRPDGQGQNVRACRFDTTTTGM
jgi:hypothetical protein